MIEHHRFKELYGQWTYMAVSRRRENENTYYIMGGLSAGIGQDIIYIFNSVDKSWTKSSLTLPDHPMIVLRRFWTKKRIFSYSWWL